MDPDQQQTLQPLTQPAHTSHAPAVLTTATQPTMQSAPSTPVSQALPASLYPPPPAITRGGAIIKIIGTAVPSGFVLGLKCGAVYGALCGLMGIGGGLLVLITVPLGAIIGLVVGAIGGALFGLVEGLILGIISATCFYPLRSWTPYREMIGVVSVLVALVPLIADMFYVNNLHYYDRTVMVVLVWVPMGIGCVCAWLASYRVVDRYATDMGVAPGSLPFEVDQADIYDPTFQQMLFDRLQPSYEAVAGITSLGMLNRWRGRLVALMDLAPDARVCDLMSGGGALWDDLLPQLGPEGRLVGIERSPTVVQASQTDLQALADPRVEQRLGDALNTGLPDRSVSAVTCAFGPMLVSPVQISILADEIARILDDHGVVALVDMGLPASRLLRWPWRFYLRRVVPLVGFVFGGDPILYSTLARFVEQTIAMQQLEFLLTQRGFQLFHYRFSGGFATALVGMKLWKSHNH